MAPRRHGYATVCVLLEEVGRAVAPVPVLPTLILGALPVAEFGSPEQRGRLLPGVANGDLVLGVAGAHGANHRRFVEA